MAEYQLYQVLQGALRGTIQALQQGKPHGGIPWWLIKKGEHRGKVIGWDAPEVAEGALPLGQRMVDKLIELYLTNDDEDEQRGFDKVHLALRDEFRLPDGREVTKAMVEDTLKQPGLLEGNGNLSRMARACSPVW